MNKIFLWCCVVSIILVTAGSPGFCDDGFYEDFASPTLDPAWQVVEFTGPRVYGITYPANHISLTDNPGHLRYYLDPMTHYEGFVNDYQVYSTNYNSYDPGLDLHRIFTGDHWTLETKVDHYMPYTNGRQLSLIIYFGDGGSNTYYVVFGRDRDVNRSKLMIWLLEKYGPTLSDRIWLETVNVPLGIYGPSLTSYYFKLKREGGILTAMYSTDSNIWETAYIVDMESQLDGLTQRVVISGASWFNTGGSYADYDYVKLTPLINVINCTLDIDPDTLNLKSKGKWITAYIELPGEYDPNEIDINTVKLLYDTNEVPAGRGEIQGDIYMVKFARNQVKDMLFDVKGLVELKVNGKVGETMFEGTDSLRVK